MKHICKYCGTEFSGRREREFCSIDCHLRYEEGKAPLQSTKKVVKSISVDPKDASFLESIGITPTEGFKFAVRQLRIDRRNKQILKEYQPLFIFCIMSFMLFACSFFVSNIYPSASLLLTLIAVLFLIFGMSFTFSQTAYFILKSWINNFNKN